MRSSRPSTCCRTDLTDEMPLDIGTAATAEKTQSESDQDDVDAALNRVAWHDSPSLAK